MITRTYKQHKSQLRTHTTPREIEDLPIPMRTLRRARKTPRGDPTAKNVLTCWIANTIYEPGIIDATTRDTTKVKIL